MAIVFNLDGVMEKYPHLNSEEHGYAACKKLGYIFDIGYVGIKVSHANPWVNGTLIKQGKNSIDLLTSVTTLSKYSPDENPTVGKTLHQLDAFFTDLVVIHAEETVGKPITQDQADEVITGYMGLSVDTDAQTIVMDSMSQLAEEYDKDLMAAMPTSEEDKVVSQVDPVDASNAEFKAKWAHALGAPEQKATNTATDLGVVIADKGSIAYAHGNVSIVNNPYDVKGDGAVTEHKGYLADGMKVLDEAYATGNPHHLNHGDTIKPMMSAGHTPVVDLENATYLMQKVKGTNAGSIYLVVALTVHAKIAVRIATKKANGNLQYVVSMRCEGHDQEQAAELSAYMSHGGKHYSAHFECNSQESVRSLIGGMLFSLGFKYTKLLTNIDMLI